MTGALNRLLKQMIVYPSGSTVKDALLTRKRSEAGICRVGSCRRGGLTIDIIMISGSLWIAKL